jgi:membrane fusion protein, multidrug efflux system
MRIGQPVELISDLYGSHVKYQGTVVGVGMGTGSAFALLPAQNATGNWIKVVQRVPVRIALRPGDLRDHPLRIGLSMRVKVSVHDDSGHQLAQTPHQQPVLSTAAYDLDHAEVLARIAQIIRENSTEGTATTEH